MNILKSIIKNLLSTLNVVRGNIHRNDRQGALYRAWGHIFSNHLPGDYVEFGVYTGGGVIASLTNYGEFKKWLELEKVSKENWRRKLASQSKLNSPPTFHCLDTFTGMPENDERNPSFAAGTFNSNYDEIKKRISSANNIGLELKFYKGLFSETGAKLIENLNQKKIAIANIDCDLESSTRDALNIIADHIQIGTIVMFDDYNAFCADNRKGQRAAFLEFQNKSEFIFESFFAYHFCGQSFLTVGRKT